MSPMVTVVFPSGTGGGDGISVDPRPHPPSPHPPHCRAHLRPGRYSDAGMQDLVSLSLMVGWAKAFQGVQISPQRPIPRAVPVPLLPGEFPSALSEEPSCKFLCRDSGGLSKEVLLKPVPLLVGLPWCLHHNRRGEPAPKSFRPNIFRAKARGWDSCCALYY